MYVLLFSDRGLSPAAISSLFIIWSTTSFVLEIPSGAWADVVDRRLLLVVSAAIYAAGFALWILWPTYPGFAIGFVLWGFSGALMSGTFEAYLYDGLVARGAASTYARLLGRAEAAAMVAALVGTASAAPLYGWGGYALVGWASVGAALIHGLCARSLPDPTRTDTADATAAAVSLTVRPAEASSLLRRYGTMLRSGMSEAIRRRPVRHLVLISAVLMGVSAYDEYFGLLARDTGASTADIPILMSVVAAGQVAGTAAAGRTATMSRHWMALVVAGAGVLVAAGAVTHHPIGIAGAVRVWWPAGSGGGLDEG